MSLCVFFFFFVFSFVVAGGFASPACTGCFAYSVLHLLPLRGLALAWVVPCAVFCTRLVTVLRS